MVPGQRKRGAGKQRIVENSEAATKHSFSGTSRVPCEADARCKVVAVGFVQGSPQWSEGGGGIGWVGNSCCNIKIMELVAMKDGVEDVTHAEIQGEGRREWNVILHKGRIVSVLRTDHGMD